MRMPVMAMLLSCGLFGASQALACGQAVRLASPVVVAAPVALAVPVFFDAGHGYGVQSVGVFVAPVVVAPFVERRGAIRGRVRVFVR